MANPNPNSGTRFKPGYDPRRSGRLSAKFICDQLDARGPDGNTPNDKMVAHLIEVGTSWEVIVVGHGDEPLKVASGRDSVKACEVLWSYALGKPMTGGTVSVPPGIDPTNRETLEIIMEVYRHRLIAGELGEAEFSELGKLLMGAEKAEAELIARILGDRKGISKALRDRAEALLARLEGRQAEAQIAQAPALPSVEPSDKPPEEPPCP